MSPAVPETLRVACAVESEGYVRHCAAMLHSLLAQHSGVAIRIDYLHGQDTSARGRARLQAMVEGLGGEIVFRSIPQRWLEGLPIKGFTGKATWYRIFLPELLPDADRVLYLDADLLVVDSLLPLWAAQLDGNLVGAVTNVLQQDSFGRTAGLGLSGKDAYFNAGVLLMDLGRMRGEGITEQLRSFSVTNAGRLGWRDQDALNIILHERRFRLHPRWNCMNSVMNFPWAADFLGAEAVAEARRRPAIRHFEGPSINKPWHLLCDPPVRQLYAQHRRQTPWPHVRPSGCTPVNLLRYLHERSRGHSISA